MLIFYVLILITAILTILFSRDPAFRYAVYRFFLQDSPASRAAALSAAGFAISSSMLFYLKIEEPEDGKQEPNLQERLAALESNVVGISEEAKYNMAEELASKASSILLDRMNTELDERHALEYAHIKRIGLLESIVDNNIQRLNLEVRALLRRGNLNLVLGTLATAFAVTMLVYTAIFTSIDQGGIREAIQSYMARLGIVIFIQLFGFFFLRLYRVSLSDIKYFQNEITNIQQKWLALKCAIIADDKDSARLAIESLAATERNFVLKKGETTIELERSKIENNDVRALLAGVKGLVDGKNKAT